MKQLLFLLLPLLFFACKSEESITPAVTFERDFAVVDNAADPVQHARYEIYKKYGVPVYFNDTVAVHGGTAPADSASRRYETVDLNWTFFGYSRGVEYRYDYLRTAEEQLRALRFVDAYLGKISRQMRPFSVMVADTLTVSSANKVEKPIYHVGFRTLVLARVKDITVEDSVNAQIAEIVNSMVSDRIKANRELCGEFADVSTQKGWYDLEWKRLNETSPCPTVIEMGKKSYVLSVNALYDQPPYTTFNHEDLVTLLLKDLGSGAPTVESEDEAIEIRDKMLNEIGAFGFIRGWNQTGSFAPRDADEDREYFIKAMLWLGDGGFRQRYGHLPVVMTKYEILRRFVTGELGVNLDYNRLNE